MPQPILPDEVRFVDACRDASRLVQQIRFAFYIGRRPSRFGPILRLPWLSVKFVLL